MNQRKTTQEQEQQEATTTEPKPTPNKLDKPPGNGGLFFGLRLIWGCTPFQFFQGTKKPSRKPGGFVVGL